MSGNWLYRVKHVQPGEPVQAGVVSRPDRAIEDRTDYLKDRLDAAELGRAIFDADATIAPDVLPGQPVFWNYTTQRYEQALAAAAVDEATQVLLTQPSSDCVGLCLRKKSETQADIVLRGIVRIPELTNAIGEEIAPGRYYLSAVEPGKLVQQRPPVSVYVCYVQGPRDNCSDVPSVVVMPHVKDFIDEHTHYRFDLVCRPAGTNTAAVENGQSVNLISNPNTELPGWLPADHSIFNGKAPSGAVFGYNLSQHTELARVWPPIPIQSVAVLWDKGAALVGATEVPLGVDGLVICDNNGIWWMSNCTGDTPWPADYTDNAVPFSAPGAECPREETMRIAVVYIRMLVGNDRNVVTSLAPQEGSPITVTNCDGLPAKTGDLELNLKLQVAPDEIAGGLVFKDIINDHQLQPGWVTEGLIVHEQAQVLATSVNSRELTAVEKDFFGFDSTAAVTAHQGLVNLTFDNPFVSRELLPQIVRLSDTVERLYLDIPYLGFPPSQESLIRLRFNVPDENLDTGIQMRIRARMFGGATGTFPALVMTKRNLSRPAGATAGGAAIPETDDVVTFNSAVPVVGYSMIELESEPFAVTAGDVVLVTLKRESSLVYSSEIGLIKIAGIIQKPES